MIKTVDEYTRELEIEFPNATTYKLLSMVVERNKIIEDNTKILQALNEDLKLTS